MCVIFQVTVEISRSPSKFRKALATFYQLRSCGEHLRIEKSIFKPERIRRTKIVVRFFLFLLLYHPNHPYGAAAEMRCEIFNPVYPRSPLATNLSRSFSLSLSLSLSGVSLSTDSMPSTEHPVLCIIKYATPTSGYSDFMGYP